MSTLLCIFVLFVFMCVLRTGNVESGGFSDFQCSDFEKLESVIKLVLFYIWTQIY